MVDRGIPEHRLRVPVACRGKTPGRKQGTSSAASACHPERVILCLSQGRDALDAAYDVDRILEDAIGQSYELLFDVKRGMTDLGHMHDHIVFGQSVFYADVDELSWKSGDHTYTVGPRIGSNRKEGWMIIETGKERTEIVISLTS